MKFKQPPGRRPPPGVNLASFFIVLKLFNAYNFNIKLFHTIYFYHVFPPSIPTRSCSTSPTQPTLFFLSEDIQTKEHKSNQTNKKPSKTINSKAKQNKTKSPPRKHGGSFVLANSSWDLPRRMVDIFRDTLLEKTNFPSR